MRLTWLPQGSLSLELTAHVGGGDDNLPVITAQHVLNAIDPVGIEREQAIRLAYRLNLPNHIINELVAQSQTGPALAMRVIMRWQEVDEGGSLEEVHHKLATALRRCKLGRIARRMQVRERAMSNPEGSHVQRVPAT